MPKPMTCPTCGQTVDELRPGQPRIHYVRGTNDYCMGGLDLPKPPKVA